MGCKILFDVCSDKQKRMINSKLTVFLFVIPYIREKQAIKRQELSFFGENNLSAETSYLSYSNCSVVIGMNKL